jgi:acid phosphatase type 7
MSSKFGTPRPKGGKQTPSDQDTNREPLPPPTGKAPFRLALSDVVETPLNNNKMVFHVIGDSGGIDNITPESNVAEKLLDQFDAASGDDKPVFLYHLGDVVYFNGEWSKYFRQYFNIFAHYTAPIFAIPGNHDGLPLTQGDTANSGIGTFVKVFCDKTPKKLVVPEGPVDRYSNIQPNVYWTLQTPLANIIGLYTNVSESQGYVDANQKKWFLGELKQAATERKKKAIIVALHHPPYSVDKDHGESLEMQKLLTDAFTSTKVVPDLVLSGHVHNYQRFTNNYPDGSQLTYVVCGSSGYYHHSYVDEKNVPVSTPNNAIPGYGKNITFEKFSDDHWGFMRLTIENTSGQRTILCEYFTAPLPSEPPKNPATLYNSFQINLDTHKVKNLT